MARTKKNSSSRAKTNTTGRSKKPATGSEQPKEPSTLMKGVKNVGDILGGAVSKVSEATLVYGIGGMAFFAIASYFGLGLIGTLLVALAAWAVIEVCYILFSDKDEYKQKKQKIEEVGQVFNIRQAA